MSAVAVKRPRASVAWFRDTLRWDVAFFQQIDWHWDDDLVHPAGSVIHRRREEIDSKADCASLPIIEKISFGGDISVTAPEDRIGYKGRLFWARPGDLVYSKIRVKQGSLAFVADGIGELAVSAEYPVYEINTEIVDRRYLALVFRSSPFMRLLEGLSHGGSTKTRIPPEEFERQLIPLPPLPAQRKIVAVWEAAQKAVAATMERVERLERETKSRFLAELGLEAPERSAALKAFVVDWKNLERWGVQSNQLAAAGVDPSKGEYPVAVGRDCLIEVKHGCSASPSPVPSALEVLKISAVTRGQFNPKEKKFAFDVPRYRQEFALRAGDVLMCRTNGTLALVGMSALVRKDLQDTIFPDKLIRVRCKPNILPAYFATLVKTRLVRSQIEAAARTAVGNYAIGSEDIWALRFPLPPLNVQQKLMRRVEAGLVEVAELRKDVKARGEAAKAQVEAMILGTKPV